MIQGGLLLWYKRVKLLQSTPKTCKRFNACCWNEGLAAQTVRKCESCKGPPKTSFKLDVVVGLHLLVNIMSRSVLGRGSLVNIELLVLQKPGNFVSTPYCDFLLERGCHAKNLVSSSSHVSFVELSCIFQHLNASTKSSFRKATFLPDYYN